VRYADRTEGGRWLAERLTASGATWHDPLVLGLPRGGVPVAAVVAGHLHAPLDVVVARKVAAPDHPELGIGAVAEGPEGPVVVIGPQGRASVGRRLDRLVDAETVEVERRVERYRGGAPLPRLTGRDVILVDDGLATGVTAEAALRALRAGSPRRLVLAVPVGATDAISRLAEIADEVVCPMPSDDLRAVGLWYDDFSQTSDDEVLQVLAERRGAMMPPVTIADQHALALDATAAIVEKVSLDQLEDPTPCEGWDVRALLNHVVSGNWWAAELGAGKTIDEVGDRLDGDVIGDDPSGTYRASAAAAAAVFLRPGALDAPCAVSYGPVPGSVYAGHRLLDIVIHGWDLAKATGQDTTIDPALVQAVWDVINPQMDLLRASGMFGTDEAVPEDADSQTQLLATLGRHP
jgi:putative phosphoribosyl transferase